MAEQYQQWPRTLDAALKSAAQHMISQSLHYRYGQKGPMDKKVRKELASIFAEYARLIETHRATLTGEK